MPIAVQRDIGYPGRLVPFLTTVLFAFFTVVPLNLPGFAVVMPSFALMAVFHWTVYRPDLLPLSAVFASGFPNNRLPSSVINRSSSIRIPPKSRSAFNLS